MISTDNRVRREGMGTEAFAMASRMTEHSRETARDGMAPLWRGLIVARYKTANDQWLKPTHRIMAKSKLPTLRQPNARS